MYYQTELMVRERQDRLHREAAESRMQRLAGGRERSPVKPIRVKFFSRG